MIRTRPLMAGRFQFRLGQSPLQALPEGSPQITGQCVNPDGSVHDIGTCALVDTPLMWSEAYPPCDPPCGAAAPPPSPAPPAPPSEPVPAPPAPPSEPVPAPPTPPSKPVPVPPAPPSKQSGVTYASRPTGAFPGPAFQATYLPQVPLKAAPAPSAAPPAPLAPCPAKPLKVEEWTRKCALAPAQTAYAATTPSEIPQETGGSGVTTGLLIGGGIAAVVAGAIALGLFR